MGQHYTSNTVSVSAYCRKCEKPTQHRVEANHKKGPCLDCIARQDREVAERRMESAEHKRQKELFL